MYAAIFLVAFICHTIDAFSCPSPNGTYINPDDYRSYYVCSNFCYQLEYCSPPSVYFTRINQTCIPEPPNWQARYNLTGQYKSAENTDTFIRQDKYSVYISHETSTTQHTLIARYINETHAIGIQTAHRLTNKCTVVFNVRIVATDTKAYCYYGTLHPYSSKCDLLINSSENYCKTY